MPGERLHIVLPAMVLLGLTFGAATFQIRAMAADVAYEARLATGIDRLGQIYGLLASTCTVGAVPAVGVTLQVLDRIGFRAARGGAKPPDILMTL